MRFERTPTFDADFARLSATEKRLFTATVMGPFIAACDRRAAKPSSAWPTSLRVKSVQGAPGILEMTWSFSGPDGRATFEWIVVDGEARIRWRRVGGHAVFKKP